MLPECVIRGDLKRVSTSASSSASVSIGRYAFLDKQVLLRPPFKIYKGYATQMFLFQSISFSGLRGFFRALTYYPVQIGNFVSIGSGTVVEAASLGSYIMIGKNCIVDKFAIIKDCVVVRDGAVIPSTVCIPPFSIVSGNPATVVATLPESAADFLERYSRQLYALHGQMLNADCITEIMSSVFDDQIDTEVNFE